MARSCSKMCVDLLTDETAFSAMVMEFNETIKYTLSSRNRRIFVQIDYTYYFVLTDVESLQPIFLLKIQS